MVAFFAIGFVTQIQALDAILATIWIALVSIQTTAHRINRTEYRIRRDQANRTNKQTQKNEM